MTWRNVSLALGAILSLPTAATSQVCADVSENACLAVCGTFTQACFDLGTVNPDGFYQETIFNIHCTTGLTGCIAYTQGINYCTNPGDCSGESDSAIDARMDVLRRAAPGAPIFIASCSGSLLQVDIRRKRKLVQTANSPLKTRPLINRQVAKN